MFINHFTSEFPSTLWWPKQQYINTMEENSNPHNLSSKPHLTIKPVSSSSSYWPFQFPTTQNPPPSFDLNNQNYDVEQEHPEKEHLFEKPLTPSDVGKLNRLVIPKQHAERYFPLAGDSVEKGLLLSFEDELGKCWRFRYSYWNSSQSYVLTKGWSRYVKEKQLDASDVVFFERHRNDVDRFFIGWRRKGGDGSTSHSGVQGSGGGAWSRGSLSYSCNSSASAHVWQYGTEANVTGGVQFLPDSFHAGTNVAQNQTMPTGNPKRLRLFGVNLECQPEDHSSEPSTPDGSSISSQGQPHHQFYTQPSHSYSPNSPSHMEGINFSRDVNHMRNRRG